MGKEKLKEILLNRIYEEIKQSNVNRIYAELLLDNQIAKSRYYNIAIIVVSSIGALGSIINEDIEFATYSSILVAFASLGKQLFPLVFLKTEDIAKLTRLHTETYSYFNKLQDVFCLLFSDEIDTILAQAEFSKLTIDFAPNTTDISRIFGKIDSRMERKAVKSSDDYLNTIYNNGEVQDKQT